MDFDTIFPFNPATDSYNCDLEILVKDEKERNEIGKDYKGRFCSNREGQRKYTAIIKKPTVYQEKPQMQQSTVKASGLGAGRTQSKPGNKPESSSDEEEKLMFMSPPNRRLRPPPEKGPVEEDDDVDQPPRNKNDFLAKQGIQSAQALGAMKSKIRQRIQDKPSEKPKEPAPKDKSFQKDQSRDQI